MPATGEPRRWTSDPPGEPALKPAVSQSSRVDVTRPAPACVWRLGSYYRPSRSDYAFLEINLQRAARAWCAVRSAGVPGRTIAARLRTSGDLAVDVDSARTLSYAY